MPRLNGVITSPPRLRGITICVLVAQSVPNGIIVTHTYDSASQLTGLTYGQGVVTLGTLTYTYDLAGRRTEIGGTWARTGLPRAVATATFDAANRLTNWAGTLLSYDANGNLASDGPNSYLWNGGQVARGYGWQASVRRTS